MGSIHEYKNKHKKAKDSDSDSDSSSNSSNSSNSSKRNHNLDAYYNKHSKIQTIKKPKSPKHQTPVSSYTSLDKNSKIMHYLNNQKVKTHSPKSSSHSDSKSSDTIKKFEEINEDIEDLSDILNDDDDILPEKANTETTDSESEYTETEPELPPLPPNNGKGGETIHFTAPENINGINIKRNHNRTGYMSLPVNENISKSGRKNSFYKEYSNSIDNWASSFKKTVLGSKMEALTMTYNEIPPSVKAYRKKVKYQKSHPEFYAEEEGVPVNYNYEAVMNYNLDETNPTTEVIPSSSQGFNSNNEDLEVPEGQASENLPLIPKPEDLEDKSSFSQTCFNSVNILVGIGLISLPFSFFLTGWVVGAFMFIFFALLTMHTAKIIGKCMKINNLTNYSEIGYAAFGKKGYIFISMFFSFELFACSVSLVILIADSLVALFPNLNGTMIKALSFFVVTPLTYPKHFGALAWGSLVGIFAIINLITILFYDGFSKPDAPGSLLSPATTYLLPVNYMRIPLAIGIIMAGFSGHSVFPTIYHNMREPEKFNKMVNITYCFTFIIYFLVAAAGYAMFGENTLPEITQNIAEIPVYSKFFNRLTIWLMVINPITKYGITLIPLDANIEQIYGPLIDCFSSGAREIIRISSRTFVSFLVVFMAIVFPEFHQVLCLLGSLFSMIICVIFPCLCYNVLYKGRLSFSESLINKTIIAVSSVIAIIGTVWAFIPNIL